MKISGISTSCSNGFCTISCGGEVQCEGSCSSISSSCSNGKCQLTCNGGSLSNVGGSDDGETTTEPASGSCEQLTCYSGQLLNILKYLISKALNISLGLSTSCSNGVCSISCGGTVQCSGLQCSSLSTSCSNGNCKINCNNYG